MAVAEKIMPSVESIHPDTTPRRVQDAVMLDLAFRIRSIFGDAAITRYDAESLARALLATSGATGKVSAEKVLAHLKEDRSKDAAERLARMLFPELPA